MAELHDHLGEAGLKVLDGVEVEGLPLVGRGPWAAMTTLSTTKSVGEKSSRNLARPRICHLEKRKVILVRDLHIRGKQFRRGE